MGFVARTNVGKMRSENQDSTCVFVHAGFVIGIVADGMGGHNGGSFASSSAIACLKAQILQSLKKDADEESVITLLKQAYNTATAEIYEKSTENTRLSGMGTTLAVALLRGTRLIVSNIGDSRAYLLDEAGITQLTVDQTLVQSLLDSGEITPEEAKNHPQRHIILEAVGTSQSLEPDIFTADVQKETVLLCSDGLYGEVEDAEIRKTVLAADDLAQAADKLITYANVNGGRDNITVVLLNNAD